MSSEPPDCDEYAGIAEYYDCVPAYSSRRDVEFYIELARESPGAVLEIGCGTGRVLIPTARAGVSVTGLDASEDMLCVCKRKLAAEPSDVQQRVTLLSGDMRGFDFGRKFRLITVPFRPFQHLLTVEDQLACLRCVRDHLSDDGRFVLDLFNPSLPALITPPDSEEQDEHPGPVQLPGGGSMRRAARVLHRDVFAQIITAQLCYYVSRANGTTDRLVHEFQLRYLFRFEVEHLLARVGFEVEALYAGYNKEPFGSITPGELIFVARKA